MNDAGRLVSENAALRRDHLTEAAVAAPDGAVPNRHMFARVTRSVRPPARRLRYRQLTNLERFAGLEKERGAIDLGHSPSSRRLMRSVSILRGRAGSKRRHRACIALAAASSERRRVLNDFVEARASLA